MSAETERPLKALIIDDEALARERLGSMLAEIRGVSVAGEADSGSAAVKAIAEQRPDLIFLDVQMPGLDGFGVLRCTTGAHRPLVVFVTAHDEHAVRAFDVHAADYLLKPVTMTRLREAVRRAIERTHTITASKQARGLEELLASVPETPQRSARIPVKGPDGVLLLNVSDIDWLEADADLARVHVGNGVHSVRETMAELEARLTHFHFARVHRSAIVNVEAVRAIEPIAKGDYYLTLRSGARVRSSRQYRLTVQALRQGG